VLGIVVLAALALLSSSDHRHRRLLLRARRERQADGRATEQRYELAASHCPMPPVVPPKG